MPGMDGFETSLALRREAQCDDTRIIALSGNVAPLDSYSVRHAYDGFMEKPFAPEMLAECLKQPGKANQKPGPAAAPTCSKPEIILDLAHGLKQFRGVWTAYSEILRHLEPYVDKFMNEFHQQLQRQNAVECRRMAHSLKGAMALIGAWKVNEAAKQLEQVCAGNDLKQAEQLFAGLKTMLVKLVGYTCSICHQSAPPVSPA